jgi:hypothetical protein
VRDETDPVAWVVLHHLEKDLRYSKLGEAISRQILGLILHESLDYADSIIEESAWSLLLLFLWLLF